VHILHFLEKFKAKEWERGLNVCRLQSAAGDEACGERDLERDAAKKLVKHQNQLSLAVRPCACRSPPVCSLQSQLHKVKVKFVVCVAIYGCVL